MARQPDRRPEGSDPDPAAGGGPHQTVPHGDRPTWRPESERAGRGGFLRAALVVLGITLAVWLAVNAYSAWMNKERGTGAPEPGATGAGRGSGAGYEPPPGTADRPQPSR